MKENNWLSLISPRFAYRKDSKSWLFTLYDLKNWQEMCSWFKSFHNISKEILINIFESEYKDRFINRLDELYPEDTRCFNINEQIVLKICISFPETFYKLQNDNSIYEKYTDKYKFIYWCKSMGIWWEDEELIWDFYQNVRCGLYHIWSLWWWRNIDYENDSSTSEIDKVIYKKWWTIKCICLTKFISKIKESINDYIDKLKNDDNLYDIFTKKYVNDLNTYLKWL